MKYIWLLFEYSDEHKSPTSERVRLATTSRRTLTNYIAEHIENGYYKYNHEGTPKQNAKRFRSLMSGALPGNLIYDVNTELADVSIYRSYDGDIVN